MTKTLKTLINTSLLLLFVSNSYGLAFNLTDINNRTGVSNDPGVILLDNTTSGFNGIDDTFDGRVIFNFTLTFDTFPAGGSYAIFALEDSAGSNPIAIGNSWSSRNWDGLRIDKTVTHVDQQLTVLDYFGTNAIAEGVSQAFTMTIDYNAGALDTGTLSIDGDTTTYDIRDYDYSFDKIRLRNGLADNTVSATNMSVEVVPEPATYALIFGSLALVFVAFRRRFKA